MSFARGTLNVVRLFLLACFGLVANAQISGLASTYDGGWLYFSSPASLRGSGQQQFAKIFRWSQAGGIEPFAARDRLLEPTGYMTNFYALTGPTASSDGSLVGFTANRDCASNLLLQSQNCSHLVNSQGVLETSGGAPIFQINGVLRMSPNGLHVLAAEALGEPTGPAMVVTYDLTNPGSEQFILPGCFSSQLGQAKQPIADDGTVAGDCSGTLGLIQAGQVALFPTEGAPRTAAISAQGNTAVYDSWAPGRGARLYALDRASGLETFLYQDPGTYNPGGDYPDLFEASVSDDGSLVLLLARDPASSPRQWLLTISADGQRSKWFGYAAEGYLDATLSGDGRIVFAVTANNRVTRTVLATGETTEIIPPSPWIGGVAGPFTGSSLNLISGGGFANTAVSASSFPAPLTLNGVGVQYNLAPLRIVEVRPDRIAAQLSPEVGPDPNCVPPDLTFDPLILDLTISVTTAQQGPFDDPVAGIFTCGRINQPLGIFHDDWTADTVSNAVQIGETVILLVAGLGPVNSPVAAGVPAPASPPIDAGQSARMQCGRRKRGAVIRWACSRNDWPVSSEFVGALSRRAGIRFSLSDLLWRRRGLPGVFVLM